MNRIVVGILCGRGDTPEALATIAGVRAAGHTGVIMPLFGVSPANKFRGYYVSMPDASQNKRGRARTTLLRALLHNNKSADVYVFLDDDTVPQPGYFDHLAKMFLPEEPLLMGGNLLNSDGQRSWDVCSFQDGNPVVVPHLFWNHPQWYKDLYLSGPQHIFNRPGVELAYKIGYPDKDYGEDTGFCFDFKAAHGQIVFIPEITAKLAHLHKPPNEAMWSTRL
jgi:hypothetical protein